MKGLAHLLEQPKFSTMTKQKKSDVPAVRHHSTLNEEMLVAGRLLV